MGDPTVSVVLPVYNGEAYLRTAIDSVMAQTLQDFELLIIDDGSTDSTPAIARSYGERVKYIRQANTGVAGAFNHGLRLAKGRYISWLSHDDVFLPGKLEKQVVALERAGAPAVSYTDVMMIDEAGQVISEMRLPEYSRRDAVRHVLSHGQIGMAAYSICYDRRCIDEVGVYSEYWRYTQDAEMLLRLARRFALIRIPELLMKVREHYDRGIRSKKWEQEVVTFYRRQLAELRLSELFPEIQNDSSRGARSEAYLWLADNFAAKDFPLYRVAYSQYWRALRENPADAVRLLRRIGGLYWRHRGQNSQAR
jgi:glycosyltransferase involved in cell wall biosynthesis